MNEAVISLARLNGTTNITVAEESKTVKTSTTTFSAVPTEKDETTVTIEIEDGEQYTIKFIKITIYFYNSTSSITTIPVCVIWYLFNCFRYSN